MIDGQWISFKVGSENYAHSVTQIKEIIPYTEPVPVPGSPFETEGILNVRGNIVTILSGRTLFNKDELNGKVDKRIIILELAGEQIGVTVDSVGEIITFDSGDVEWLDQGNKLIKGTVQIDKQLYILTDFTSCT